MEKKIIQHWRQNVSKEGAGYKMGGEPVPHKSIEFDNLLFDLMWPMQNFFEMLLRSEKNEDRDFAAVGASLYRDASEKWGEICDVVRECLGDVDIDFLTDEEMEKDIGSQPHYVGVTITPNQEKKNA